MSLDYAGHARRLFMFGLVGVSNTTIDFAVFAGAYYGLATPVLAAHIIAFLVAATNSYLLNQKFTFARAREDRSWSEFLRFLAVTCAGLAVSAAVLVVLADQTHVLAAKAGAILCTLAVGYLGSTLFVFRKSGVRDNAD